MRERGSGWLRRHHLSLHGFTRRDRFVVLIGVLIAAIAAVTMIKTSSVGPTLGQLSCFPGSGRVMPAADLRAALTAAAISMISLTYGLAVIAGAGARTPWTWRRLRYGLVMSVPFLLTAFTLVVAPPGGAGWRVAAAEQVRTGWAFVALVLIVMVLVATRLQGPPNGAASALLVVIGCLGFGVCAIALRLVMTTCQSAAFVSGGLGAIGFLALAGLPVLLIWLAAEGLKLSSSVGTWASDRLAPRPLLAGLLAVKLLVVLSAAALVARGAASPWLAGLAPTRWAIGLAVPVAVLVLVLLAQEQRLIGAGPEEFNVVSRGFAFVAAGMFSVLAIFGVLTVLSGLPGRPQLALALIVTIGVAAIAAAMLRRFPSAVAVTITTVAVLTCNLLVQFAYARATPFQLAPFFTRSLSTGRLGGLLGLGLLLTVVALLVMLVVIRRNRRYLVFLGAVLGWIVISVALPAAIRTHPGTNAVAVDLVLTVFIVVLAVRARRRPDQAVSEFELLLLLITTTVVIEGPVLIAVLLDQLKFLQTPLLILAYVSPAIAVLTVEAGTLNTGPHRRERVLIRIGVMGASYGLLGALASTGVNPLSLLQSIGSVVSGMTALPIAIVLVAVTSAARSRGRAGDRISR